MDGSFDLSKFNDESSKCTYNPGYKTFCLVRDHGLGKPGTCDKIYGLMNFFYPREPPALADQSAKFQEGACQKIASVLVQIVCPTSARSDGVCD